MSEADAAKFSQHKDGRHAGQSGKAWVQVLRDAEPARGLAQAIENVVSVAPCALARCPPDQPVTLSDAQMSALHTSALGTWPFVGSKWAGDYTSMDVGRLWWTSGVVLGNLAAQRLGPQSFELLLKMQGSGTRKLYSELGVDKDVFDAIHTELTLKARPQQPPPAWSAPASQTVLSPGVLVHVCEYAVTCKDHEGLGPRGEAG